MRLSGVVVGAVVALSALSACDVVPVEVSTRHPTPRPLWPRPVATVKTYEARPPGGVAVYGLQASGEDLGQVEAAVREKAASLGCDGILLTVRMDQGTSQGVELTGKLNAAREYMPGRIDALCMVDPASIPEICAAATGSARAVAATAAPGTTPALVDGIARGVLEHWRRAYEARSGDALARLYSHDASLSVVDDGIRLVGWTAFEPALRDRVGRAAAVRVRFEDVQVHAVGATAVIVANLLRERSDAGTRVTEHGSLTLVLQASEAGSDPGWVIVAEHYSKHL